MFYYRIQYRLKSDHLDLTAELMIYAQSDEAAAEKAAAQLQHSYPECSVTIKNVTQITFGYF